MTAPILTTDNLGLDIGGATIVAGVGLEVPAGEFLGIIGPNGAGKTSLFNLLSGLLRPTSGTVTLAGHDVTHAPPPVGVRERPARGGGVARRDAAGLAPRFRRPGCGREGADGARARAPRAARL